VLLSNKVWEKDRAGRRNGPATLAFARGQRILAVRRRRSSKNIVDLEETRVLETGCFCTTRRKFLVGLLFGPLEACANDVRSRFSIQKSIFLVNRAGYGT
jgi:hypothetical protein